MTTYWISFAIVLYFVGLCFERWVSYKEQRNNSPLAELLTILWPLKILLAFILGLVQIPVCIVRGKPL